MPAVWSLLTKRNDEIIQKLQLIPRLTSLLDPFLALVVVRSPAYDTGCARYLVVEHDPTVSNT